MSNNCSKVTKQYNVGMKQNEIRKKLAKKHETTKLQIKKTQFRSIKFLAQINKNTTYLSTNAANNK